LKVMGHWSARTVDVMADGTGLCSRAGTALLALVAERVGLTAGCCEAFAGTRRRRSGHQPGRVFCDLAVMLADGGRCVSDLAALAGFSGPGRGGEQRRRSPDAVGLGARATAGQRAGRRDPRPLRLGWRQSRQRSTRIVNRETGRGPPSNVSDLCPPAAEPTCATRRTTGALRTLALPETALQPATQPVDPAPTHQHNHHTTHHRPLQHNPY
jgi:hypothetical protein